MPSTTGGLRRGRTSKLFQSSDEGTRKFQYVEEREEMKQHRQQSCFRGLAIIGRDGVARESFLQNKMDWSLCVDEERDREREEVIEERHPKGSVK